MNVNFNLNFNLPVDADDQTLRLVLLDALQVAAKRVNQNRLNDGPMVRRHSTLNLSSPILVSMSVNVSN